MYVYIYIERERFFIFLGFRFHLRTQRQQLDEEPMHKICGLCVCFNLRHQYSVSHSLPNLVFL